jgi:hypothetical protein
MTREETEGLIHKEFGRAREALAAGNDGRARVCARRAAGVAITFWLQRHGTREWGLDAMNQLRSVSDETSMPESVRDAAARLTTKVTEQFTSPFSTDPVADGTILVEYFLQD